MEKKQIQILRRLIKEMAFGSLVGPMIDPQATQKSIAGYYRSRLFKKKAESFFRDENWPYPVYVLPYISEGEKFGVYHIPEADRTRFYDMDEGLKIAERIGFDISEVKDRSGFVICPNVGRHHSGVESFSLWVMFHAMIEGNWIEFSKLITSTDRLNRAADLTYMMQDRQAGDLVSGTFTMASARNEVLSDGDTLAEALTQELLERHRGGFRTLDHMREYSGGPPRALTDEESAMIEEFTSCIKICAAEFVENCRGKICFPSV